MASLRKTALIVVCFAAVAGACSSGDQAAAPEGPLDGGRLAGPPDVPALEVIRDYVVDEGVPEELIERTASGILVARNQLDVAFRLGATVGEINAAVDSVDGEIIGLVENAAVVLIRFPDPGNTVRLLEIREELEARDSVEFAALDPMPVVSMVPENLEPETDGLPNTNPVDHHLAARGHAAWNARRAIAQAADKPTFILSDLFCDGDLGEEFDVSIISSSGLDRPGIFHPEPGRPLRAMRHTDIDLETTSRILTGPGGTTSLQPKSAELLAYLITHPEQAVSKAQLLDEIWSGVVVTEGSLTRAMSVLRKQLETVGAHGFLAQRFQVFSGFVNRQ